MLISTKTLLTTAQAENYAIGAFNVYNLEGVRAVIAAAEAENSPAMLQIHPGSLKHGGLPLVALCLAAARQAKVPFSVHLDHSSAAQDIKTALQAGLVSIMADGSHLKYDDNVTFTRQMTTLVHQHGGFVEAELGRLTGTEDDLTVPEHQSKLTDSDQAIEFVNQTQIDALAVCIGNVHGRYHRPPQLDFQRLEAIRNNVAVPLVLHGASGLPNSMIEKSIEFGVCKFNVNTEIRGAYLTSLKENLSLPNSPDLVPLMQTAITAMQAVVVKKLRLFKSVGKA
ncbi:MAG: class II fructose-bisphosphate aldolase family protein [Anaerolineae bacterium]|nr:class II fructose-bisphosphate aldolase family protein [Anaerolineae bacterium]